MEEGGLWGAAVGTPPDRGSAPQLGAPGGQLTWTVFRQTLSCPRTQLPTRWPHEARGQVPGKTANRPRFHLNLPDLIPPDLWVGPVGALSPGLGREHLAHGPHRARVHAGDRPCPEGARRAGGGALPSRSLPGGEGWMAWPVGYQE